MRSKVKKACFPKNVFFVDTETDTKQIDDFTQELAFLFGVWFYAQYHEGKETYHEEEIFDDPEAFGRRVLEVLETENEVYIFAANAGFDLRILSFMHFLHRHGFIITQFVSKQKLFMLKAQTQGEQPKVIRILDVFNYGVRSVKDAGQVVGLPKLDFPVDLNTPEGRVYCKRDVEIIYTFYNYLMSFILDHNLGCFQPTIPSYAYAAFHNKFLHYRMKRPKELKIQKFERAAYFGGRAEAFYIGKLEGEYFYLDINSMYPAVMLDKEYPTAWRGHKEKPSMKSFQYIFERFYVIAKVKIKAKDQTYPVRHNQRLVYAKGEFVTYLHHAEIERALENGDILEILEISWYEQKPLFREYVEFFYGQRLKAKEEGNRALDKLNKLFLNSLYGKFGQKGHKQIFIKQVEGVNDWTVEEYENLETHEKKSVYNIFGRVTREEEAETSRSTFTAIAGAVTAYAREYVTELMSIAGWDHVFYVDTDGFIVDTRGMENLSEYLDERQLGMLKVEHSFDGLEIFNVKQYQGGGVIKRKGIRKDAKEIAPQVFEQIQFEGIRGAIRKGHLQSVYLYTIVKKVAGVYKKGLVTENGRVLPYSL